MISIMFICHGNICRSTMAEFVFRDMVDKKGIGHKFRISSRATSNDEIGSPVYPGTKKILDQLGISCKGKTAVRITKKDYADYDYLLCMDEMNVRNTLKIVGEDWEKKVKMLLDYSDNPRSIADPWYTGDFEETYRDVLEGCTSFLEKIRDKI